MLQARPAAPPHRRGVILLVVMILLALFAVVGITFVLYAETAAVASRVHKEAEAPRKADVEPELLLSYFLSQLLYDVQDNRTGTGAIDSALRGHSLARNMLGYYDPSAPPPPNTVATPPNDFMYNGVGRMHTKGGTDDYFRLNFQTLGQGQVADPEHPGSTHAIGVPAGAYAGGFNVGYTYPDLNNCYLASQRPSDGAILLPSFVRPNRPGQFTSLRAQLPATNPPDAGGCDVKNYMQGPGLFDGQKFHNNDSIWMDLGFPVHYAPDGTRYKPLFAPLILDMDNRINLLAHGNIRGAGNTHVSNQGFGPWEVNMSLLSVDGNPKKMQEWANLFVPSPTGSTLVGRYGSNKVPDTGLGAGKTIPQMPTKPRFFSQTDFDGCDELNGYAPSGKITLPNGPGQFFPTFGNGYGNFSYNPTNPALPAEFNNHPSAYCVYPGTLGQAGDDLNIGKDGQGLACYGDMEALLRYGDTGSPMMTSNLFRYLPMNLGGDPSGKNQTAEQADAARIRRLITLLSSDVDQPAVIPWIWDRSQNQLMWPNPNGNPNYPTGASIPFPTTQGIAPGTPPPQPTLATGLVSEFGPDWRSTMGRTNGRARSLSKRLGPNPFAASDFGRLDLNRDLPPFPAPDANGNYLDPQAFQGAMIARQTFAKDIFMRLCVMTNAAPCFDDTGSALPVSQAPGDGGQPDPNSQDPQVKAQYAALRWLAQLAVNIVDYIDEDDVITCFNWNPNYANDVGKGWVFGTELPRLVLAEGYAQYKPEGKGTKKDTVDVGVKLLNPFKNDTVRNDPGTVIVATMRQDPNNPNAPPAPTPLYQIAVCKPSVLTSLTQSATNANPLGTPQASDYLQTKAPPGMMPQNVVLDATSVMQMNGNQPVIIQPKNGQPGKTGYSWICTGSTAVPTSQNGAQPDCQVQNMTAEVPSNTKAQDPVLVLQRLAVPGMPHDDNPSIPGSNPPTPNPTYNPWVTVDYMDNVPMNKAGGMGGGQSVQRKQPYVASQTATQAPVFVTDTQAAAGKPDWLVHLDRQLVSLPEVLMVSAYQPCQLTHQFMQGGNPRAHMAPWFDQQSRLYRSLEFFNTHLLGNGYMGSPTSPKGVGTTTALDVAPNGGGGSYTIGVAGLVGRTPSGPIWHILPGTRLIVGSGVNQQIVSVTDIPGGSVTSFNATFTRRPSAGDRIVICDTGDRIYGRININTVMPDTIGSNGKPASTVFRALCDAQAPNYFSQDDVDQVFQNLMASRTINPTGCPGLLANENGGQGDRPFLPHSIGVTDPGDVQYPAGSGINDTIFRNNGTLFNAPNAPNHPYLQQSLLTKIYNSITTRSNVFAIWVTVGFFQVQPNGTLGNEIGKTEGRQVRHRMFALVDRSTYAKGDLKWYYLLPTPTVKGPAPVAPGMGGGTVTVTPTDMKNIHPTDTVTFVHTAQSDQGTISGLQQPDKIIVSNLPHSFDVGASVSFTVQVPVFDAKGNPVMLPGNIQVTQPKTFNATLMSPMTDGKGVLQVSDPSILKYVQPGSTSATVSDTSYSENVSVIQVLPAGGPFTQFTCNLKHVYNQGDEIRCYFDVFLKDPANPGPQTNWNTRDHHGTQDPILYFSIID